MEDTTYGHVATRPGSPPLHRPPHPGEQQAKAESVTAIRVVSWRLNDGRQITAVHAPESDRDRNPWIVYEGDRFVGRFDASKIPPTATIAFAGTGPLSDVEDGIFYEVVVDRQKGTGIRNSPLTKSTPDRPWAVSLHNSAKDRLMFDHLPDGSVAIIRPIGPR